MIHARFHREPVPLGTVLESLQQRQAQFRDRTVPASVVRVDPLTRRLRIHGQAHELQPQAQLLLANKVRVPNSYLSRCPAPLAADNLNHWLERLGDRRLLLRMEGDQVRAVLSPRYQPVDHLALVEELLQVVPEGTPVRFEISRLQMVLEILPPEAVHAANGHDLFGGISLRNSEVGFGTVCLSGLVFRVICLNGLILTAQGDTSPPAPHAGRPRDPQGTPGSRCRDLAEGQPVSRPAAGASRGSGSRSRRRPWSRSSSVMLSPANSRRPASRRTGAEPGGHAV